MTTRDAELDRQAFRDAVADWHQLNKVGSTKAADARLDEMKTVVADWAKRGQLAEFLSPLTVPGEDPYVRLNAASGLLNSEHSEAGAEAMDRLHEDDLGVPSRTAGLFVSSWRRKQTSA